MANVLKPKMLKIDTASATPIWNTRVKINNITVSKMTTVGHQAVITDVNGNPILDFLASEINDVEQVYFNTWFNGIVVPTLTSGVVDITLD